MPALKKEVSSVPDIQGLREQRSEPYEKYGERAAQGVTQQSGRDRKFFLGASTAGHQVNGGEHDQWTAWENAKAEHLAATAEQRVGWLPNWVAIEAQATDPDNYRSGTGVEHWRHYREDFQLLKKLGLDSFRLGMEWAELEPVEGQWDIEAIARYRTYFAELKKQHITPFVTLWHWTHPVWFEQKGGFSRRANIRYFERYARKVLEEFGSEFNFCFILNEPNVYMSQSFITGEWPPQEKSKFTAYRVYKNLMEAHRRVYRLAKQIRPEIQIGIAQSMFCSKPSRPSNVIDKIAAAIPRWMWNYWFVDRTRHSLDFIGVNFYMTDYRRGSKSANPLGPANDMGWYMEPGALQTVLEQTYRRYRLPLIVSENGLADAKDQYREWWIRESIAAVGKARTSGADVFGYLHWSLLDNFEWAHGWWPKFGLISVDRSKLGMPRTIRGSANTLARESANLRE